MLTILPNTLTHTQDDIIALCAREKIATAPLSWHTSALMLDIDKNVLTSLPEFAHGYFYLQNPSSLLPVIALNPQPGEKVLDLAAAPGGKTIHIAIKMHNTGEIVANDVSAHRVARMRRILATYGATNTKTSLMAGQRLWMKYKDYFDRVLLDAPCSMHGTDTPSTDNPSKMARLQRWLLRSAVSACKPGGVIVYSTCTTAVEENEEVIDWILRKDQGKVQVEPVVIPSEAKRSPGPPPTLLPALTTTASGIPLHPSIVHCMRVAKSGDFEGFFVAKMRRVENGK